MPARHRHDSARQSRCGGRRPSTSSRPCATSPRVCASSSLVRPLAFFLDLVAVTKTMRLTPAHAELAHETHEAIWTEIVDGFAGALLAPRCAPLSLTDLERHGADVSIRSSQAARSLDALYEEENFDLALLSAFLFPCSRSLVLGRLADPCSRNSLARARRPAALRHVARPRHPHPPPRQDAPARVPPPPPQPASARQGASAAERSSVRYAATDAARAALRPGL